MTTFQFISDLLNIIDGLFEAGVDGCNVHETRCYLDDLFDSFEEHEGTLGKQIKKRKSLLMKQSSFLNCTL